MLPKSKVVPAPPTPVAQVQSERSRQLRSDPDLQRAIAASLEQPSSRKARAEPPAEDEQSQQTRRSRSSRQPLPPPPPLMRVGDAVDGHYGADDDELWWPATVTRLRADGSVDVRYDDGDVEEQKPRSRLRPQPLRGAEAAKAATEGEGGGGGGGSGTEIPSSSDA